MSLVEHGEDGRLAAEPQVNNLINANDLPDETRLSHYALIDGSVSEIPLPASLPLFLAGLAGLGAVSRKRRTA